MAYTNNSNSIDLTEWSVFLDKLETYHIQYLLRHAFLEFRSVQGLQY